MIFSRGAQLPILFLTIGGKNMNIYKIFVPTGALGAPFPEESLEYALSQKVDAIALDAGSTDSGPYYLGSGTSTKAREVIKTDLRKLMKLRNELGVPLIIGSCGTCGTNGGVDWTRDICLEIAAEENLTFKLGLIYSEQDKEYLKKRLQEGRIEALPGAPPLSEEVIESCSHIVGVMGTEPIIEALEQGAEIILGGRATDTAIIAAVPLMKGIPVGLAWHGAKIAECGSQCSMSAQAGGVILHFDQQGFEVETSIPEGICTPYSVSAHMVYENADPYNLREPGKLIKTKTARYTAVDHRRVRVEGSDFEEMPYTIKLEGAGLVGYQTIIMAGMTDPRYIANIDQWQAQLIGLIRGKVSKVMKLNPQEYTIEVRRFGLDGVTGVGLPEGAPRPREVEVMIMVTAKTQELATAIVKLSNAYVLHMPLTHEEELPSLAFPFSPAQFDRGPVYQFKLHHVVAPDSYQEMMQNEYLNVGLRETMQR
jgi:hypothetical protein